MLDDPGSDRRIEQEIDSLFEAAEREQYVHSRSKETFDSVAGLWFLGDAFQSVLARISSNYIVSSFLLNSLGLIYQRMRSDYDLPEFDASTLTDEEALQGFMKEIERVMTDEALVKWLRELLIPKCEELLDNIEGRDLDDIARLGNLADSTEHIAKQYVSREDGDTWVYDSIFQFSDELLPSSEESVTFEEAQADIICPPESEFAAHQNTSRYDVSIGGSATNIDDQQFREVA